MTLSLATAVPPLASSTCGSDGMYPCIRGRSEYAVSGRFSKEAGNRAEQRQRLSARGTWLLRWASTPGRPQSRQGLFCGPLLSAESRIAVVGGSRELFRGQSSAAAVWSGTRRLTIAWLADHAANETVRGETESQAMK
ncbi:hypothetical protein AOQ84DRAFT_15053 [Glonium stellatum]|uniref:Uncharacterized protein n=1 Tax=Glonium stellatum TaxID=574774 RepID=A0A8E2F3P2_9PEZI|nr:hypothetical protein AOQ84DRAFT_15053 [Glonium stellatum]